MNVYRVSFSASSSRTVYIGNVKEDIRGKIKFTKIVATVFGLLAFVFSLLAFFLKSLGSWLRCGLVVVSAYYAITSYDLFQIAKKYNVFSKNLRTDLFYDGAKNIYRWNGMEKQEVLIERKSLILEKNPFLKPFFRIMDLKV